jgi:hypothetical protein
MDFVEIEWLMLPMPPEMQALLKHPSWYAEAACRGHGVDTFFPTSSEGLSTIFAICANCAVKRECLECALEDPTLKVVWGGPSARGRARLRRGRVHQRPHRSVGVNTLLAK